MSFYRNIVWYTKGLREYTKSGFQAASALFDPIDLNTISMENRCVLVTGANSGLGLATCKQLAKCGATLHMLCRSKERGEAAIHEIQGEAGSKAKIELHLVDMSEPKLVRDFAKEFASKHSLLDILINNAGCMINDLTVNRDGLEANFVTNTLSTYILTETLIPLLDKSSDPRVITVSSGGMLVQKLNHADPSLLSERSKFDGTMVYAQNKRQQVAMTEVWARKNANIHFSSMHPGWADTPAVASSMPSFHSRMQGRLRTAEEGADTIIWLAVNPNLKQFASGQFFQDRRPVSTHLRFARTHSSPREKEIFMNNLASLAQPYM